MSVVTLDQFSGLQPRTPAQLLPPHHATVASHCDLAYGELRPTRRDLFLRDMDNAPQSLYTDNGLTFYSWPDDVSATRSPMANDIFDRVYFTGGNDFRVASRSGMHTSGGAPASSYRVGVPRPSAAPTLAMAGPSPLSGTALSFMFHYELGGVKYQEQAITLNTVTDLEKWTCTPPASNHTPSTRDPETGGYTPPAPDETPASAVPVVRLIARSPESGAVLLEVYSSNSRLNTDSTWILSISKTGSANDYTVTFAANPVVSIKETRAYVYTYANTYGEEGPPSPPATVDVLFKVPLSVTVTRDSAGQYAPIKEIRIYRTANGSDIADYFFVAAIPVLSQNGSTFTFVDNIEAGGLNEPLSSEQSYPPNPLLVGLIALGNGILMAWKGNELHFSDAYRAWSWPPSYVKTFPDVQIVGAIATAGGALITTTGKPYRISGITPDGMNDSAIPVQQAGVSRWSIADLGGVVVYASHDGLITFDGGIPTMDMSNRYFTRDVWRARVGAGLDTMRFSIWDGRLIVYSSAGSFTPFMLGLDEARGALVDLPNFSAKCSIISPLSDQCYFARGTGLYQFAGGAEDTAKWVSREIEVPAPTNYGVAQVACTGNWTLRIYADGVLRHTQSNLSGNTTFRLPGGFLADRWMIDVTGSGQFKSMRMATTPGQLRRV